MKRTIYLDYAAATPLDAAVLKAMQPYFADKFYNPSATYLAAKAVKTDLDKARAQVASVLGARPAEIIFTAGGTEANNLAIHGIMQQFPEANVLASAIEHESVLQPAHRYQTKEIAVDMYGIIDVNKLRSLVDDKTVLISVMLANNEIGTIQPVAQVARLVQDIRRQRSLKGNKLPLYVHSDACQAGNYLDLQVHRLGVDFLTLNGGKIYGPKQSGALYVKAGVKLQAQILGGGQERGLRSGTENVAQSVGFATALVRAQALRSSETTRLTKLRAFFVGQLAAHTTAFKINGSLDHRLANNLHLAFAGQDNERLMMALDEAGIICGVGSACSASSEEPSHVLTAIGLSNKEARASLRFSMGRSTNETAIRTTVETLAKLLA